MLASPIEQQEARRRRNNIWYCRWYDLVKKLKRTNMSFYDIRSTMLYMYGIMELTMAHRSQRTAHSSFRDLVLALSDCAEKSCETCEHRYECYVT